MDPADLQVMSHPPFDPATDVRITHTVHQGRAGGGDYQSRGLILNHYLRGPSVGKGQHGTVFKCWDLAQNNVEVAIKVVSRHNPRADRLNQLKRRKIPRSGPHLPVTDNLGSQEYKIRKEIAVMKLCRHPHVVRLLEVIDDKLYQKVYMVMEFLGGGEIKWRDSESNPVLRVDQTRRICRDVILGLEYLHFQGIIHRDIKPANLMWTSDRRTVKITDFGVAHISAAQRLAGSGKNQRGSGAATATPDSDTDLQLLFDDSELCKTAGTPSFLAPEVIYDFGTEILPPSSSSDALAAGDSNSATTLQAPAPHRPPITKAIDVWALGVTLYCLLLGKTPFRVESNHEFALYGVICTQDWDVGLCMGLDRIPTEGRRHNCPVNGPCSEGAEIIRLLERLLEKDVSKRITLDEVKRHRWFLRDIPDHERWVRETLPDSKVAVAVTEDAISDAVSPIRFRWRQRLTNRLTSFLRTVRPQRSFRSADGHSDSDDVGVRSMPSVRMSRYSTKKEASSKLLRPQQSNPPSAQPSSKSREIIPTPRSRSETQHQLTASSSGQAHRYALADISSPPRSKSSDTRPHALSGSSPAAGKGLNKRRGSASVLAGPDRPDRPAASVHSFSPSTDEPRPRSRFSLSSLRWRRGDPPAATSTFSPVTTSTPVTPPRMTSREPSGSIPSPTVTATAEGEAAAAAADFATAFATAAMVPPIALIAGDVALAMRASSWGDMGEYGRFVTAHEAASMHSGAGDHDEPLDPDVVVVGAGGFANGPLPPTPSGSAGALAVVGLASPYVAVAPTDVLCHDRDHDFDHVRRHPPPLAAPSPGFPGSGNGEWDPPPPQSQAPPRSLMRLSSSYSSEELGFGERDFEHEREDDGDDNDDDDNDDDDDDDDDNNNNNNNNHNHNNHHDDGASDGDSDSFFARNSEEAARRPPRIVVPDMAAAAAAAAMTPHQHHHHVFQRHTCGVGDEDDHHSNEVGGGGGGGVVDVGWGVGGERRRSMTERVSVKVRRKNGRRKGISYDDEDDGDEDNDDDDDDSDGDSSGGPPIEVRRRRPSWTVHDDHDHDHEHDPDYDHDHDDYRHNGDLPRRRPSLQPPPIISLPLPPVGESDSE